MSLELGIRLLETLTSALYEDPIVFFREYVQNSVDAYIANPVGDAFRVDINIDNDTRSIIFLDNGSGIEPSLFTKKMTNIGKSEKGKMVDQIGFRGIGRLSAMPFCEELIFTNKYKGENSSQIFSWNGRKYNQLLSKAEQDELENAINEITNSTTCKYDGDIDDHFFKVEVKQYGTEIEELIKRNDFEIKLSKLLPLKYSEEFTAKELIHQHYLEYMGESLERFEFDIFLNNKLLLKPYDKNSVLESDIVFWDLSFEKTSSDLPAEKIGVLWFTFNRKMTANSVGSPRGVFTRSKNMLLGNSFSIADAVTKSNSDYVATYRELTQTLSGLYGELLIDAPRLSDNARRDWFRIDNFSNQLRIILVDFLRKLKEYRYAASNAFNDKSSKEKRKRVISAYSSLTGGFDTKQFEKEIYDNNQNDLEGVQSSKSVFLYANEDIPRRSATVKKFYEEILQGLKNYYIKNDSEEGINDFIKIRTYLKDYLNNKK